MKMTKKEAFVLFHEQNPRHTFLSEFKVGNGYRDMIDDVKRRQTWSNFCDELHRDGKITDRQANTWSNPF